MAGLQSEAWYRVASRKPRLRSHARLHRQVYRGQLCYLLQDRTNGRFHRLSPASHHVVNLMDGERTVQEIWDTACGHLPEQTLTQDDVIRLLGQLHSSDVLRTDVLPDLDEVGSRSERLARRQRVMSFMNPLAIRFKRFDPDRFLEVLMPFVRPVFSVSGGVVLLLTIVAGALLAAVNWSAITENVADRVLATENLLLLLVTYPLVKALHELGHGFAVKRWGGEVHEIGVMLLVLMPVPYVDASAATAYPDRWQRALVAGAGIIVELVCAVVALLVFLSAEEGLVRAFAFNVMLIGGVSTLLFNGNPLLRFDGYFVLSDLLEIPNMGTRSNRYIGYLIQRHVFGVSGAVSPVSAPGEAPWMFGYSIASFAYRLVIVTGIAMFVATQFLIVGVLVAVWALVLLLGLPLVRQIRFLVASPALAGVRTRALAASAGFIAIVAGVLLLVPAPYAAVSQGIVWAPGNAVVYAGTSGFVSRVPAHAGMQVAPGAPVLVMTDPFLEAEIKMLSARVRELELQYRVHDITDPAVAKVVAEQLSHARADLELALEREKDLVVRAPAAGRLIMPNVEDLPGAYLRHGGLVAYVRPGDASVVRVIVDEDDSELVQQRLEKVEIRLAERFDEVIPAEISREVPSLSDSVPSLALTTQGGGDITLDPLDPKSARTLANLLHLELMPESPLNTVGLGSRVYVRFTFAPEPLGPRFQRTLRQVFLRQFGV